MNASVSIITPVYNGEAFLERALASILRQSHAQWEWIIVNDGSRDGTHAILDRVSDRRIRVFHQANAGVSAARNVGLAAARGAYVTFLDADDRLPPDSLAIRAGFLDRHPDVDIVNGGVRVTKAGRIVRRYHPDLAEGPLLSRLARLEEGVFFNTCYMVRRNRIGAHRFPTDISHCEDLIFFLTLAHEADLRYGAVAEEVYEYRVHPGSAMSNLAGLEAGYLELLACAARMERIDQMTRRYQARRVARILFRSWLRRGHLLRAIAARRRARGVASQRRAKAA